MKLLFLATASEPWGELVVGLRVAAELHARGAEIILLAPRAHAALVAGLPYQVELHEGREVTERAARLGADAVVLVNLTTVYIHLKQVGADRDFLGRFAVPVLALDLWNLPATSGALDFGESTFVTSPHARSVDRRLVPVPFIAPGAAPGCFDALPKSPPVSADERAAARRALGLGEDAPLVLTTTAVWQSARAQGANLAAARSATLLPERVAATLGRLGPSVHLAHAGPEPLAPFERLLGPRYHFSRSLPPPEFRRLVAAADCLLTFNLPATSITTAIAAGLPVVVGVNSAPGTPLGRFRAWPYGFYDFMTPIVADNPYLGALRVVELLDEPAFAEAIRELLFQSAARAAARERLAAYRAEVGRLPSPADRVAAWLGGL